MIDNINNKSNKDYEHKKIKYKLRKQYQIISNINNYSVKEKELYDKFLKLPLGIFPDNPKYKKEKINFEITRIIKELRKRGVLTKNEERLLVELFTIYNLLNKINIDSPDNIKLLDQILEYIIIIELKYDIKIGLYEELCQMYSKEKKLERRP